MNLQIYNFKPQKILSLIHGRFFNTTNNKKTVDKSIVESLERLALVDFSTEAGIARLQASIQFADGLMEVDTSNAEPLINIVYEINRNVREDIASGISYRKELMKIAPVTEEFYYVAPLGTFSKKQHDAS